MRGIHLLAALPLTCLFAQGAFAQGACTKPLTMTNQIQMESADGGPSTVPVKINGTDQKLTLAMAASSTTLSADAIKTLKLEPKRADSVMVDDAGNQYRDEVTIADFSMGRLHGTNVKWPVSAGRGGRGGGGGGGGRGGAGTSADGQLGQNYMRIYDIDVDFGSDKLSFFNQDHCPGGVMYWKAPGAIGVVPISIEGGRVTVPVTVDGKQVTGVIDTSAAATTTYVAVASRVLGIELGGAKAPADTPSKAFNGQSYAFTGALSIGALSLADANIQVNPDVATQGGGAALEAVNRSMGVQSELAHPEVKIGMNVLRKLHLYFAFGENRLYVTGTTNTLPAAAATPVAAKTP